MKALPIGAALSAALCLLLLLPGGAAARPHAAMEPLDHTICRLIESAARAHRLPVGFVTRLIWRESSFRTTAISSAGAQGVAQFMPHTARERGLADPFDPEQAIPEAAHLLAELRRRFGNLGIAAAAYNAGPGRVADWLRGEGELPAETRAYVRFITERAAEAWIGSGSSTTGATNPAKKTAKATATGETPAGETPEHEAAPLSPGTCLAAVAELRRGGGSAGDEDGDFAPLAPWGVQLAGNFSKAVALASFERARQRLTTVVGDLRPMVIGRVLRSRGTRKFYQVRLPAPTRAAAEAMCSRIQSAGGVCVALRS